MNLRIVSSDKDGCKHRKGRESKTRSLEVPNPRLHSIHTIAAISGILVEATTGSNKNKISPRTQISGIY